MKFLSEKNYRFFFDISVLIKAVVSVGEIALGIVFYAVSTETVNKIIFFVIGAETAEQPRDLLWNYLLHGFQGLTPETQSFWAFILLSHGVVKIFLVYGLLNNKLWAYPSSAVVFALFAIYQAYSMFFFPSFFLGLLTVFDVVLVFLILHEYRYKRRHLSLG